MSFEAVWLFSIIELDVETKGPVTLGLYTDLPHGGMQLRESKTVDTSVTTATSYTHRGVVRFRMSGTTKGHQVSFHVSGNQIVRLFGGRVYMKSMGNSASNWDWFQIPGIVPTQEEWAALALPIPATSEEWSALALPIPPTSEEWAALALPIPATSQEWNTMALPIPPTSEEFSAVKLPVEATPDERRWHEFPVAP